MRYHHVIANVFRSTPPAYAEAEDVPSYPIMANAEKPTQFEKTVIAGYINDMKVWTADQRKMKDDK